MASTAKSVSKESPTPAQAQELLVRAENIGRSATKSAGWPAAITFISLAMLGSFLMIGLHMVATSGYGGPLLAGAVGVWAAVISSIIPVFQRSAKVGFTRRFLMSLISYFVIYTLAVVVGVVLFSDGNLAYYLTTAIVLASFGLASAFREIRS